MQTVITTVADRFHVNQADISTYDGRLVVGFVGDHQGGRGTDRLLGGGDHLHLVALRTQDGVRRDHRPVARPAGHGGYLLACRVSRSLPATVIAVLTILGFSLYDTVVVFDKVRENTAGLVVAGRKTYTQAANDAVNQTLMRSINTSLIALLPVASLLFIGAGLLGAGTLKDLALAQLVGLASGAYSSIFIATPLAGRPQGARARNEGADGQGGPVAGRRGHGPGSPQRADQPVGGGSGAGRAVLPSFWKRPTRTSSSSPDRTAIPPVPPLPQQPPLPPLPPAVPCVTGRRGALHVDRPNGADRAVPAARNDGDRSRRVAATASQRRGAQASAAPPDPRRAGLPAARRALQGHRTGARPCRGFPRGGRGRGRDRDVPAGLTRSPASRPADSCWRHRWRLIAGLGVVPVRKAGQAAGRDAAHRIRAGVRHRHPGDPGRRRSSPASGS